MHAKICKYSGSVCWDLGEVTQIDVRDYFDANTTIQGHHGAINYTNYNLSVASGYLGSYANWTSYSEQYMAYMQYNDTRYRNSQAYQDIEGWGEEGYGGYGYHGYGYAGKGVYQFEQVVSLPYILGMNYSDEDLKARWEKWQTYKSEGYKNDQSANKNYYNYRYGYNPNRNQGCAQGNYQEEGEDAEPYWMKYYNETAENEYRKYYDLDNNATWANASWANTTNYTNYKAPPPTFEIFDDFLANTSQFIIRVYFMPMQQYRYEKSSYRLAQDKLYCHVPFKVVSKNFNANLYFKKAKYKFTSYYRTGIRYFSTFSIVGLLGIAARSMKKRKLQCCACLDDQDDDDDDFDDMNSVKDEPILDDGTVTATDFVSADSKAMMPSLEPQLILPPHMARRRAKKRVASMSHHTIQVV